MTKHTVALIAFIATILGSPLMENAAHAKVTSTLRGGTLTISGDCKSNCLDVFPGDGLLFVYVGEEELGAYDIEGVEKVVIKSKGKGDKVYVNMPAFIDLCINTSCGDDLVEISGYCGAVEVTTGGGDDLVLIPCIYISGKTEIKTGCGRDVIMIGQFFDQPNDSDFEQECYVDFCDDVAITMGGGRDELYIFSAYFGCDFDTISESLDIPVEALADEFEIDVEFRGGCGQDCYWFGYDLGLESYLKSFEGVCEDVAGPV